MRRIKKSKNQQFDSLKIIFSLGNECMMELEVYIFLVIPKIIGLET